MQHYSRYQNQKPPLQIAFLKSLRKAILLIAFLFTFSLLIPDNIKAQIANIISEDGDGIAGITSLMNATINDDVQAVQFFSKSSSSNINQKNIGGATALHIAARRGNMEIAKILIENGANINAVDNEGWTPLMRAVTAKNPDLVRFFINNGADASKVNSVGETAIINSAAADCSACLEQMFSGYNFIDNMNIDILRKQLEEAMVVANNKNDAATQLVIKDYVNSEVNKSRAYSLIANHNAAMPVDVSNNKADGVVIVKSLDQSSSAVFSGKNNKVIDLSNQKPIYKFLSKKDPVAIAKEANIKTKTTDNLPYKANVAVIKTSTKKFSFKGYKNESPFVDLKLENAQKIQPKILTNSAQTYQNDNQDKTPSNEVSNSKYKFLGQKKSAPEVKK